MSESTGQSAEKKVAELAQIPSADPNPPQEESTFMLVVNFIGFLAFLVPALISDELIMLAIIAVIFVGAVVHELFSVEQSK